MKRPVQARRALRNTPRSPAMARGLTWRLTVGIITLLALGLALACDETSDRSSTGDRPAAATSAASAEAPPQTSSDAPPASHADWCGGHGLPESKCTKCNPELIEKFKATQTY